MNENKRISISEFTGHYNKLTNADLKEKYVKKHIINTYAPFIEKINILNLMNDKAVNEDEVKYIDLNISKLNLAMTILVLYTDIEPDKSEDGKVLSWEGYDKLQSVGLINQIVSYIGSDIDELLSIQKNVLDTWYSKNTSTEAYLSQLFKTASERFGIVVNIGLGKLASVMEDEKKMDKLLKGLEKLLK